MQSTRLQRCGYSLGSKLFQGAVATITERQNLLRTTT